MKKPDTPLHEKSYAVDWIVWVNWWIQENKYATLAEALAGTMRETRGIINPSWVAIAFDQLKGGIVDE